MATYPHSIPNRSQAEAYLRRAEISNPGPWVDHSRQVARSAASIATRHPDLDPPSGYILGLLHDIGRQAGVYGMRHVMDGYDFLVQEGFPDAARICLTHSYPIPNVMVGSSPWDGTPEQARFVDDFLATHAYNPYDRLIQLCDSICLPNGPVLMEKRLIDVVLRYGFNDHTLEKWQAFYRIKAEFEQVIGCSIYTLLPEVVENTFELDLADRFTGKQY